MSVAIQALIYEIIPSLNGIVVARVSMMHPNIKNCMVDEQPSTSKLERADCFSNPDVNFQKNELIMYYILNC